MIYPLLPHTRLHHPGSRAQWRTRGMTRRLQSRWPTECRASRSRIVMLMSGRSQQLLTLSGGSSGIVPWSVPWVLLGSHRSLCPCLAPRSAISEGSGMGPGPPPAAASAWMQHPAALGTTVEFSTSSSSKWACDRRAVRPLSTHTRLQARRAQLEPPPLPPLLPLTTPLPPVASPLVTTRKTLRASLPCS